jgi:hypothetical protein
LQSYEKTREEQKKRVSFFFRVPVTSQEVVRFLIGLLQSFLQEFTQAEMSNSIIVAGNHSYYEIDPSLPEINRDMTPQELEKLILEDIHSIYEAKYAV